MARVSRNSPCPCGSGKKYKLCCLSEEEEARSVGPGSPEERADASRRLLRWARRPEWTGRWDAVTGGHVATVLEDEEMDLDDLTDALGDEAMSSVLGFTLEDLATREFEEEPENLVDDYLARRGWVETAATRAYLEALRDSAASLYEVMEVDPGRSVRVRDLLAPGDPVTVEEREGSRQLVRWDVIAARVVECGGRPLFTGAVLMFEREAADALIAAVEQVSDEAVPRARRVAARWKEMLGGRSDADSPERSRDALEGSRDALRQRIRDGVSALITSVWVERVLQRLRRPMPRMVNFDGDEIVFAKVRFDVVSGGAREAAERLDGCPELEREGGEAGGAPAPASAWSWSREARDGDPGHLERVSMGRLELDGDRLVLESNSRERGERGKELVEGLLGDLCEPGVMSLEGVEAARERLGAAAGDHPRPGGPERLDDDELHRLELEYKREHYRDWIDQELPALEGRTPREAARGEAGRAEVRSLLKEMENTELRGAARSGGIPYDFSWMWEELGLER